MSGRAFSFAVLIVIAMACCWVAPAHAHVAVDAAYLAQLGLHEGDIVGSTNLTDPDIYIVNEFGYKRLFLSPTIFSFYGHLHYNQVHRVADTVLTAMTVSTLFRNCETDDQKVYALNVTGEDNATLGWVNISGDTAVAQDPDFFRRIFCINTTEFNWYAKGPTYTSLASVPVYQRTVSATGINETSIPLSVPAGFKISLFTAKTGPLRFMAFSPDGILFVSMPSTAGLYGGSAVNTGKIFAFPDRDGNGAADSTTTVLSGLHMPHGLAFHGGFLYVAEEGNIARYPYITGGTLGARQVIASLPTGGEHISRTIRFSSSGKMYVSVGSACNNCTTGAQGTAAIWEFNDDGTGGHIFASGMRNAVGLALNPSSGELWATENGRDFLGDSLPPDEINIIRNGGNYGWPFCYGNKVHDPAFPSYDCTTTVASAHDTHAHTAPLGLAFIPGGQFAQWQGDILVARHGSWNSTHPVGYDVVRMQVQANTVVGEYPFINGWLGAGNKVLGRPVDVLFGPDGSLYLTDDMANVVYRISSTL